MSHRFKILALLLVAVLILAACGGGDEPAPAEEAPAPTATVEEAAVEEVAEPTAEPEEEAAEEEAAEPTAEPEEEAAMSEGELIFLSTQFNNVDESTKFNEILGEGGYAFTGSEEPDMLDLLMAEAEAGEGTVDLIGALHGTFPPLAREGVMMNMIDVADDLSADRDIAPAFLETGLLGTDDFLNYVPWMQATYIMAAHNDALEYLPEGADINALTWEQFGEWCKTIAERDWGKPLWSATLGSVPSFP